MRWRTASGLTPSWAATSSCPFASCGRNSCSGGSSRRIVTGSPAIASNSPTKSDFWNGSILASAFFRPASSEARIISRTATMRSSPKNMCSVRHSPMPSAPNSRALAASAGVSALARIFSFRVLSAHDIKVAKSPVIVGATVGTLPIITSPVVPLMVRNSPALTVCPEIEIVWFFSSIRIASQPTTQGLPQPRATTAACDALPPVEVKMPFARCIPATSSGLVSLRTSRIGSFGCFSAYSTTASALSNTMPEAPPGDAAMPCATGSTFDFGSSCGNSKWFRLSGETRLTAAASSISPSLTISTAMLTAADPVRLPVRVCSMYNVLSWTVNSMSCISL